MRRRALRYIAQDRSRLSRQELLDAAARWESMALDCDTENPHLAKRAMARVKAMRIRTVAAALESLAGGGH